MEAHSKYMTNPKVQNPEAKTVLMIANISLGYKCNDQDRCIYNLTEKCLTCGCRELRADWYGDLSPTG